MATQLVCGCGHAQRTHAQSAKQCGANECFCPSFKELRKDTNEKIKQVPHSVGRTEEFGCANCMHDTAWHRNSAYDTDTGCACYGCKCKAYRSVDNSITRDVKVKVKAEEIDEAFAGSFDVHRYARFGAFAEAAQSEPLNPENVGAWARIVCGLFVKENKSGRAWAVGDDCKADTLQDVVQWLATGWPEGVKKMREALGDLKMPKLADVRRRHLWRDSGDDISLEAMHAGKIERMFRTTKRRSIQVPPRLQIIVNTDANGNVTAEQLFWKGAAAIAFVEAVSKAGYQAAVDAFIGGNNYTVSGAHHFLMVRAKNYDQPVSPSVLTAITANPATLRVVSFAHMRSKALDTVEHGYGNASEPTLTEFRAQKCCDINAVQFLVPKDCYTVSDARQWLSEQVARIAALSEGNG